MITEQELMAIADRKERFELSMIYMMLHGGATFIDPLTLDDVKAIRSAASTSAPDAPPSGRISSTWKTAR